jgi:hypothetical protein
MRKLFAALTRSAFADRVSFSRKVFGKNPNNGTTKDRFFVEKLRGSLFDLFSQSEKLLHTCAAFCSLRSREFIKRGIADLTHDNLVVVQHRKPESVSFLVMPVDFVTEQRHGQHSPQTDADCPRLPQPARQINGSTATLSRKLLLFLIALASIAFGVCSPAFAQSSPILGFPPGVFDNVAARSPPPSGGGLDPATTAWISAVNTAGGSVSGGRQTIVDTFIKCLKSNSLFTAFDRYWLLAGENAAQATVDMIADASNSPVSSPTFTANLGYGPSNTASYVDTVATAYTNYSQNSGTFGGQIQTSTATSANNYAAFGAANGAFTQISDFKPFTGTGGAGATEFRVNANGSDSTNPVSTAVGSWLVSRTSASGAGAENLYFNGSISAPGGAGSQTSTPLPGASFFILGINQAGGFVAQDTADVVSSFYIAAGWSGTQIAAFESCQNAMMTSIGINVH